MSSEESDDRIPINDALAYILSDGEKDEDQVVNLQNSKGKVTVIKDTECEQIIKRSLTPDAQDTIDEPEENHSKEENENKNQNEVTENKPNFIYNSNSLSTVVAEHYNSLEEKGFHARSKTRIYHMRNFNNWIKTMLINEYVQKVTSNKFGVPLRALDMCCGKGGDLFKWQKSKITHLICADIAEVSVEQCKKRYEDMKDKQGNYSKFGQLFSAEFIAADCTLMRLREKYRDPSVLFDIVSCQFAFHYCFETLPQAERMLQNASECLKPGGYFIGTMPNAYEIVKRKNSTNSSYFGNEVYRVEFQFDDSNKVPLFGAKYLFQLEGVVDCPEFLVHFPTLVKLAKKYNLELESKEKFEEVFNRLSSTSYGRVMLNKVQALETYPAFANSELSGSGEGEYAHAKKHLENKSGREKYGKVGTLSKSEWEAISLYTTFAFRKVKTL